MWDKHRYQKELQELHHRRIYYILLIGSVMMLVFSILDYIIAREHFFPFLQYRIGTACAAALLMIANYNDRDKRWSYLIGMLACLAAGIVVLVMIKTMGGSSSPYYVGLIVILTIYTTLAPITFIQTLLIGLLLIIGYIAVVLYPQGINGLDSTVFNNVFFMTCFVCIVATQSFTETSTRKQEFVLRLQEEQAAEDLSRESQHLENEVKRRTEKQQQSEQQYQLLFESLVDDVALIDRDGAIIRANEAFRRHFSQLSSTSTSSIFDVVPERHHDELRARVKAMYEEKEISSPSRMTFIAAEGRRMIMELKSSLIQGREHPLGVQLVLRDISVREQLKKSLIESLGTIRQTEEAAILSLAKLAEYREGSPGKHLERIRVYSRIIAVQLRRKPSYESVITPGYLEDIHSASILHDIGKVAVADTLLKKKEPLTEIEQDLVRQHTVVGGDVIKEMEAESTSSGFLEMAKKMAYFHHERWDGKGYPYSLSGEDIPLEARILAVAEAYEHRIAMSGLSSSRISSHKLTLDWIQSQSGKRYDPEVVEALVMSSDELLQMNRLTFEDTYRDILPADHRI